MKPTLADLAHLHLAHLDALSLAALAAGILAVASVLTGAYALVRARRTGDGFSASSPLRRMIGAATALGLLACVLAVADLAFHQWGMHQIVKTYGANVTPADLSAELTKGYIGLAFGLVIGAIGLAGGWALEWFADGLDPSEGES